MWLAWIALQRQNSCLAFSTLRLLHGARKSNQIRMEARSRVVPLPSPLVSPHEKLLACEPLQRWKASKLADPRNPAMALLSCSHCGWTVAHQRLCERISRTKLGHVRECAGLRSRPQVYCFPLQMSDQAPVLRAAAAAHPIQNVAALDRNTPLLD